MIHPVYCLSVPALMLAAVAAGTNVVAADPTAGTVAGNGIAVIEEFPQTLRVNLTIQAKDADAAVALQKLEALRTAADAKLEQLGARTADTKWGEPTPSQAVSQQQQQMRMMMMQRLRGNRRIAERMKMPEVIVVDRDLAAEWPLEITDGAELVKKSLALTKQIREAKLAGEKQEETLSAEQQQELLEEAAQMGYRGEEEVDPSEPRFSYVSKISDENYSHALAEAFARAKRQAEILARATGAELGPLHRIAATASPGEEMTVANYYAMQAYGRMMQDQSPSAGQESREAVAMQPGKVRYTVQVTASFYLD